jgi:Protein of unknown function (DUF4054)
MTIALDIPLFRSRFPQFGVAAVFPDGQVSVNWAMASGFVSDSSWPCGGMTTTVRELALQYMTAHLMALACITSAGGSYTGVGGITTAATIDKVSVTLAAPPFGTSEWRYWLNQTPYGQQLLALLEMQAAGGFYYPGAPVPGFRGAAGGFR